MNVARSRRVRDSMPAVLIAALIAWSVQRAIAGRGAIANPAGWPMVRAFAIAALHPDLSPALVHLALVSTTITLAFAAAGTALSLLVGTVGGVLATNIWWGERRWAAAACRAGLAIPRSLHEVVWGLLLVSCLGLTPLTAILALGIHYGAITARITGETLDDTSSACWSAYRAAGAPRLVALCYGLLPPAAPDLIAYAFYRFECAIRASIVLGMIGAGGLGFQIVLSMQSLRYGEVWTFLYALIVLCGVTDAVSSAVRRRRVRPTRIGVALAVWALSIIAIALAFACALPMAIPAAGPRLWSRVSGRILLLVTRAGSAPVWTLIALFVLDAPPVSVALYGILPALRPRAITLAAYRWEECVRGTILVGLVGAGGLGSLLTQQLARFDYRGAIVTLAAFIVITLLAEWSVRSLRPYPAKRR